MLVQEDPVEKFRDTLSTLINQGKVYLQPKDNKPCKEIQVHAVSVSHDFVGYYDDDCLYLIPPALWNAVQKFWRSGGYHFPISQRTLFKMLGNRKMIVKDGSGNNTKAVRVDGKIVKCLVMHREGLC